MPSHHKKDAVELGNDILIGHFMFSFRDFHIAVANKSLTTQQFAGADSHGVAASRKKLIGECCHKLNPFSIPETMRRSRCRFVLDPVESSRLISFKPSIQ
jgi:hypothetical protein